MSSSCGVCAIAPQHFGNLPEAYWVPEAGEYCATGLRSRTGLRLRLELSLAADATAPFNDFASDGRISFLGLSFAANSRSVGRRDCLMAGDQAACWELWRKRAALPRRDLGVGQI